MQKLTLALDWTPNINHIGFFIAKEKGFYTTYNLDVTIIDPSQDNYQQTPAKKVELGVADFALCPTESIISYKTKPKPFPMIAIAAILKEDLSAIVVKQDSSISSPKDLDGKKYSSYKARYEDEIVKQMIINDGGKGNIKLDYPNKLGIWETVLNNEFDATWIFLNWEGIEAEALATPLHFFKMKDYQIPYSYSPVIAANNEKLRTHKTAYSQFIRATKEGYLFAKDNPEEAVKIFSHFVLEKDQQIDLHKALEATSHAFGDSKTWGIMDDKVIKSFLKWIYNKGLESQVLQLKDICTNELLIP